MKEARRHPKLFAAVGGDRPGRPFPIARRARPNIDGNIPCGTAHDAHQLALREWSDLAMKTAQRALGSRQALIFLHERSVNPNLREPFGGVSLGEVAARVDVALRNDDHHLRNGEKFDFHRGPR